MPAGSCRTCCKRCWTASTQILAATSSSSTLASASPPHPRRLTKSPTGLKPPTRHGPRRKWTSEYRRWRSSACHPCLWDTALSAIAAALASEEENDTDVEVEDSLYGQARRGSTPTA